MKTLCPKCKIELVNGFALTNTLNKQPRDGNTISLTGKTAQVPCLKCPSCGHSETKKENVFQYLGK